MKHDAIQAALFLYPGRHTHAVGNRCAGSSQHGRSWQSRRSRWRLRAAAWMWCITGGRIRQPALQAVPSGPSASRARSVQGPAGPVADRLALDSPEPRGNPLWLYWPAHRLVTISLSAHRRCSYPRFC